MKIAIAALIAGIAVSGCATSYTVKVDSYAEPGLIIPQNAEIAVKTEPNVPNPLFYSQIETKIRKLLIEAGLRPVSDDTARYELTFIFGSKDRTVLDDYYDDMPCVYAGYYHPYWFSHGYYRPYSRTIQDYRLVIRILDRRASKKPDSFLWVGQAGTSNSYGDQRQAVDYLLAALFRYLLLDSEKEVTITIKETDPLLYNPADY